MIKDSIECGHTIFFHVRAVSGQEGISYGKLCFLKKEYKEAIKASASKTSFLKQRVNGRLSKEILLFKGSRILDPVRNTYGDDDDEHPGPLAPLQSLFQNKPRQQDCCHRADPVFCDEKTHRVTAQALKDNAAYPCPF